MSSTDIVLEAIDEHVARLERSPKSERNTPPKPSGVLFEFLFGGSTEQAFGRLAEGIVAILRNAQKLIDDATVLVEVKRFERASFLIATAEEEMGKVYILLDSYRAKSWDKARRVVAKVEWHPSELFPRVGFIVTNLSRPGRAGDIVLQSAGQSGAMHQGRQERDQMDEAVVLQVPR